MISTKLKKNNKFLLLGLIFFPITFISIKVNSDTKQNIPVPDLWYQAPATQTTDGAGGTIFQAENNDLYVMGKRTELEALKNTSSAISSVKKQVIYIKKNVFNLLMEKVFLIYKILIHYII